MIVDRIVWRRLDVLGQDVCRLLRCDAGWRLKGLAVFRHETGAAVVEYAVDGDSDWRTRDATIRAMVGSQRFNLRIERTAAGAWKLSDLPVPGLEDCLDLDLGFTPATNLFQIRRAALEIGDAADVPVAWIDVPAGNLERIEQRYERRAASSYWYESPRFGYSALLSVDASGFVTDYPHLWTAQPG